MKIRGKPAILHSTILSLVVISSIICFENYKKKQYNHLRRNAIIKPVEVFQIGFSKCGTSSLSYFFNKNGVPSIHHDGGALPLTIYNNHLHGWKLLDPQYQHYTVFTDMEMLYRTPQIMVGPLLFKELDRQYPGSKFILNTRDKQAWLKSRAAQPIKPDDIPLLNISSKILNITPEENLQRWSVEWDEHHKAVEKYFKDRPNDLLVFDIQKDSPHKLCEFFKDYFVLNPEHYTKKNDTEHRWIRKYFNHGDNKQQGLFLSKSIPRQ